MIKRINFKAKKNSRCWTLIREMNQQCLWSSKLAHIIGAKIGTLIKLIKDLWKKDFKAGASKLLII